MSEYHKIQTMFDRDPATNHRTVIEGRWSLPEFEYLRHLEWSWTEKVDGTNVRVIWDGERVRFGGKTDNAQIPTPLLDVLMQTFPTELCASIFKGPIVVYGEGYGGRIQKAGPLYSKEPQFIAFDMLAGDCWLNRGLVSDIAMEFDVPTVPLVGGGSLLGAVEFVRSGLKSTIADGNLKMEGLVMRPLLELQNGRGHRVITKLKLKDFA